MQLPISTTLEYREIAMAVTKSEQFYGTKWRSISRYPQLGSTAWDILLAHLDDHVNILFVNNNLSD